MARAPVPPPPPTTATHQPKTPAAPFTNVQWGSIGLKGSKPEPLIRPKTYAALNREEPRVALDTFHTGGLKPRQQIGAWDKDSDKFYSSELLSNVPGMLTLPPLLRVQKDIQSTVGTEVLRPNAAGTSTGLTPSAGANWQCVSDTTLDITTYNSGVPNPTLGDNYNITDTALTTETIIGIDLVTVLARTAGAAGSVLPQITLGGVTTAGASQVPATNSTTYAYVDVGLARPGGGSWVVADLNSLLCGISVTGTGTQTFRVYQQYVVVRYTKNAATSLDTSGFRAANKRVYPENFATASRAGAFFGVGTWFLRETSSSDPTLVRAACAGLPGSYTAISAMRTMTFANTSSLVVGLNSPDNGACVYLTTDPTATPVAWTPLLAFGAAASQYCDGLTSIPTSGGSNIVFATSLSGPGPVIWWTNTSSSVATVAITGVVDPNTGATQYYNGGAEVLGSQPTNPERVWYIEPQITEATGVLQKRHLVYLDFGDVSGVPKATRHVPDMQMSHVECADFHLGGLIYSGGETPGPGSRVLMMDKDLNVIDTEFPGLNGATPLVVTALKSSGDAAYAECCNPSGTGDAQTLMLSGKAWSAATPFYSKATTGGATIAATPLAYGQPGIAATAKRRYSFVPSGVTTNVYRTFQPDNPMANPILENTTELKHYGQLACQSIEQTVGGTIEEQKAILKMLSSSRFVSTTGGSYGTARVQGSADGGSTFGLDNTFDTNFEVYNVPSSGLPALTYVRKITLDNGSTSEANAVAKTPNPLPLEEIWFSSEPTLYDYVSTIDLKESRYDHASDLIAAISALQAVNPIQKFLYDGGMAPISAELVDMQPGPNGLQIRFRQVPGTPS